MSFGECPNATPECPEFDRRPKPGGNTENGCFSDSHHIYPEELYDKGIRLKFSRLGENVIQLCRWEHNRIHHERDYPEEPTIEYMKERLHENGVRYKK